MTTPTVTLNDGRTMPQLGLGTWELHDGTEAVTATTGALGAGYRLIDTAAVYGNERSIGRAIQESGIPRDQIFLTTKLWNSDQRDPIRACSASLERLGTDYVDLYLLHWPAPTRLSAWKKLEELQHDGLVRSIGVSNFTIRHLEELLSHASVMPAVNQVECNPFLSQQELLQYCKGKRIQVEAYSPLTRASKLRDPRIVGIAEKLGRTPAQILLRWGIQHGLVVIPKSKDPKRIKENMRVFDFSLDTEDMALLDGMDEGFRQCPDPNAMP